jgi:hypothetical protein
MWDWYSEERIICLTIAVPLMILAAGLLISWRKGHQTSVRRAGIGLTATGAAALTISALLPSVYMLVSYGGRPAAACLFFMLPFVIWALLGLALVIRARKMAANGPVPAGLVTGLKVCGTVSLVISSTFLAGIMFVPNGTAELEYHVSIAPATGGTYTAYVPTLLGPDGDFSGWGRLLKVEKGSASFSFNDTSEGKALAIRAKGAVTLGLSASQWSYFHYDGTPVMTHLSLWLNGSTPRRNYHACLEPSSEVENITLKIMTRLDTHGTFGGAYSEKCSGEATFGKGWHVMETRWSGAIFD